jgi:hypothetical protein
MNANIKKHLFPIVLITLLGYSLPAGAQNFPPISVVISDSAASQGYYFLIPYTNTPPYIYDHPLMILDRYGRMIFYREFSNSFNPNPAIDFKIQKNGLMSYYNINKDQFMLMDSTFTDVDSIRCVNGYSTDQHDMQVLADNHYIIFGKETRNMNLSSYHWFGLTHTQPGGTNAEVFAVVVQEFDENKNLVWEWKGHDHYQFGDVDQVWLSNPNKVDWTHCNAVERDQDGNILISLRHFDEITKIDHATGNILWRLGGKQNQFTFPNDPTRFTGQHDIRRVSDTSISIFDNGQYTTPPVARALEYALDENNKVANLVWEYIHDPSMYSMACGNHQYIGNGNHLVDFGFTGSGHPFMVVLKPDKTEVMRISSLTGYTSYRTFNYPTLPWGLPRPAVSCNKIGQDSYLAAEPGHPEYKWSTGETTSSIKITTAGDYFVFVPYGTGYISSEHIIVSDPANPCIYTSAPPVTPPPGISLACLPNPASGLARIVFGLPVAADVALSLVSVQGTVVRELARGSFPAGKHEVVTDVSNLASGIYILSMTANGTRTVSRVAVN